VVSFGTTFNDSRAKTIGAVEGALAAAYPEYEVRRAFTSKVVIVQLDALKKVKKIVLLPFMIAAGDHAHNDMAGSGDS
jgi:cobalamin biosynthesis Co2+ chelatase CbiK